jgi:hypothetical protein
VVLRTDRSKVHNDFTGGGSDRVFMVHRTLGLGGQNGINSRSEVGTFGDLSGSDGRSEFGTFVWVGRRVAFSPEACLFATVLYNELSMESCK